jgi:hypothetical protein
MPARGTGLGLSKCRSLFVARVLDTEMAVVLFEGDDRWRALISVGAKKLPDNEIPLSTPELAKRAAYLGIESYLMLAMVQKTTLPSFESLNWIPEPDCERWLENFYAKPLWP